MVPLGRVVAAVAGVHLPAAREPEPAVRALVVRAGASVGERLARVETQLLLPPSRAGGGPGCGPPVRDGQEFHLGDLERELPVAFAADVRRGLPSDGHEPGTWRGAFRARRHESAFFEPLFVSRCFFHRNDLEKGRGAI